MGGAHRLAVFEIRLTCARKLSKTIFKNRLQPEAAFLALAQLAEQVAQVETGPETTLEVPGLGAVTALPTAPVCWR